MFMVKSGMVEVLTGGGERLGVLGEGGWFGELALLNLWGHRGAGRRTATVVSLGFSQLFRLSRGCVRELQSRWPRAGSELEAGGRALLQKDGLLDEAVEAEDRSNAQLHRRLHEKSHELLRRFVEPTNAGARDAIVQLPDSPFSHWPWRKGNAKLRKKCCDLKDAWQLQSVQFPSPPLVRRLYFPLLSHSRLFTAYLSSFLLKF